MRLTRTVVMTAGMLLTAAGCAEKPPELATCRAAITSQLLNPETVEFFEFEQAGSEDYLSRFRAASTATNTAANIDYADVSGFASIVGRGVQIEVDRQTQAMREGWKTYRTRYKSDGRLGNRVTSFDYCISNGKECSCFTSGQ